MTPLEINKRIAEIKWDEKTHDRVNSILTLGIPLEIKNWSESISDAWELFEEMPVGSAMQKFENSYLVQTAFSPPISNDCCETAAIAICSAWLKWKEAKALEVTD